MPITKAQQKANTKYVKNNYDTIITRVPKGAKQTIQDVAKSTGESTNGYIKKAVKTQIKHDTGEDIEL